MQGLDYLVAMLPPLSLHQELAFGAVIVGVLILLFSMRPRRYYFVRHGETASNASHVRQGEGGGLSEHGRGQSAAAARYLAPFSVHRIISSPLARAKETAEILGKELRVRVVYSPLLVERKNPSEIIGKPTDDPAVAHIVDQTENAYHADDYRYSDEENFIDLRRRARKALPMLVTRGNRSTCVVTHHVFLKMLLAYMLYRQRLHADDYAKLSFFNPSDNASITVCEYHPWRGFSKTRGWRVLAYNIVP